MFRDKKVLAITLARGGSKRVPGKNKALIDGDPLIAYTIKEAKKSKYIDHYVVSTDDQDIYKYCQSNDKNITCDVVTRENVSDTQTSAQGLIETINIIKKNTQSFDFDVIVEIMCTNPLKTVNDIDSTIEQIVNGDSAVSVSRIWDNHPSRVKYIEDGKLKDFYPEIPESRRQDLTPSAYVRNGSVYVMYTKNLLNSLTRLYGDISPYIMDEKNTINIDEQIDLILAEQLLKQQK